MVKIGSYSDLKGYLMSNPLSGVCWYGPRTADVSELGGLLSVAGVVSCYGSGKFFNNVPILSNDLEGMRRKCSIDDLAGMLARNGKLQNFVRDNNITSILPYDTTPELEIFCRENNIACLSSSEDLKNKLRDKTEIDNISIEIDLPTIPGVSGFIENFEYNMAVEKFGLPLFLHFAEGAGGTGNYIVNNAKEFEKIKNEKRGKRLNIKKYFSGRSCSIDICVTDTSVICGALEEMLIGAEPLNSNPTEYVGSSWFENDYSLVIRKKICDIGIALGGLLRKRGFLGFFHPDFLVEGDDVFLTELNMRFGGSCGAYAKAQVTTGKIPLMIVHAITFQNHGLEFETDKINKENLYPLDYALLVLKNNFGKPIRLSHKYGSGIYNIIGDTIQATKRERFGDLKGEDEVLIMGLPDSESNTVIEEGAFICEVVTRFPISDTKS
ncbi:hypothetical protein EPO05_00695, partial [Patescibacteria group bacterium]